MKKIYFSWKYLTAIWRLPTTLQQFEAFLGGRWRRFDWLLHLATFIVHLDHQYSSYCSFILFIETNFLMDDELSTWTFLPRQWFAGSSLAFPDFHMYELLDQVFEEDHCCMFNTSKRYDAIFGIDLRQNTCSTCSTSWWCQTVWATAPTWKPSRKGILVFWWIDDCQFENLSRFEALPQIAKYRKSPKFMSRQVVAYKKFFRRNGKKTFPFAAQSTTRWQALEERSEDGDTQTHKNWHRHRETHRYTLKQEHIE